ncbi:substrate-binding domain-containing protein [Pseudoduganella buxea]|uniref:ABC transporter substrate-binding protein n=1 Tax=Pseudoduganella buxea TaxID=1949069 RepID=A0A6I3T076_9BURK|nr:substrate-binding domain-containing protein [Pseudoduganella buxea]MTV53147.1 substrate-binding domain-containing protein [Pseudoduganella buxea]GGC00329.1 ABC transporter substrate-binding protein [Pseudoduganella buxea]
MQLKTLAACLLACAATGALAAEKVTLGVAIPTATHGFTGGIVWWANQARRELEAANPGLKIIVKTAASTPEQANQVQDLLAVNRINALVILPLESSSLTQPVAQLKNKGVYVTVVDRGLANPAAQNAYVAGDNTAFGRLPAEYLAKKLNGKGNLVILRGMPSTIDNERVTAFEAEMKKHPGIKLLDAKYGNWNRDDAFKVMQDYLTRFKQIDAVWAADDDMAIGAIKAIGQARRTDIKEVFGGAGAKFAVKKVIDGDPLVQANVSYSPKFIYDAIRMTASARLKGEALPARTIIPSVLITRANAQQFYFPDSPY